MRKNISNIRKDKNLTARKSKNQLVRTKKTAKNREKNPTTLEIKNLHAKAEGKLILKGINLKIRQGEIHAIMGPNGSGKSTLLNTLLGHPRYKVTKGEIALDKKNILNFSPDKRSLLGIFGTFQHPVEIPGLNFGNFLRTAKNIHLQARSFCPTPLRQIDGTNKTEAETDTITRLSPQEFAKSAKKFLKLLKLDPAFLTRELNKNFSGGEKKKAEILQMAVLQPSIAFLDEIDSGLDIDALKAVAKTIKEITKTRKTGIVLITHYQRLLNYITPDFVHIIHDGKIIKSGKKDLALKIEKTGYESHIKTHRSVQLRHQPPRSAATPNQHKP